MPTITDDDEGKTVVNQQGESIGLVSGVRGGKAYVDPDPGLADKIKSKLGWEDVDEDDYHLDDDQIDTITDDEVRLL